MLSASHYAVVIRQRGRALCQDDVVSSTSMMPAVVHSAVSLSTSPRRLKLLDASGTDPASNAVQKMKHQNLVFRI